MDETVAPLSQASPTGAEPGGEPWEEPVYGSPLTLDRTNWAPVDFLVPVDGTVHTVFHNSWWQGTELDRRQLNLFPTLASATSRANDETKTDMFVEQFSVVGGSLWDVVLIPYRSVTQGLWADRTSPRREVERQPMPGEDISGLRLALAFEQADKEADVGNESTDDQAMDTGDE